MGEGQGDDLRSYGRPRAVSDPRNGAGAGPPTVRAEPEIERGQLVRREAAAAPAVLAPILRELADAMSLEGIEAAEDQSAADALRGSAVVLTGT